MNVIIGHNNGGKSTIIDAMRLVLDIDKNRRLSTWDFYQGEDIKDLKKASPSVEISVFIKESKEEDSDSDDVALFTTYAVEVEPKLESCLTYKFYLPESEQESYCKEVVDTDSVVSLLHIIEKKYIRKYAYNIYGGKTELNKVADSVDLRKIDFQFVGALRDVERDMFSGRDDLLKDVLGYFLDFDVTSKKNLTKEEIKEKKTNREKQFSDKTKDVIKSLLKRIEKGKESIITYANGTGALLNDSKINFDGEISESQMLQILQLFVESNGLGYSLPVSKNGLGYNNLIYISMLLAKMQSSTSIEYMGEANVKCFPILALEEPEAHLHPELQYQFLEFLRKNLEEGHVKQIFVTTHSSSLAAKVKLDEFTCLFKDDKGVITPYYPREILDTKDKASKDYIQRYLDATRADMLFAGGIIFVEGMAEQILFPAFAKRLGLYDQWMQKQIVVINIGGRYFEHFLKLYDSKQFGTLPIRIACVTDRDPVKKQKNKKDARWESCWPVEYLSDTTSYDYKNHSEKIVNKFSDHKNIHYFSQSEKGKTLEYEIAKCNSTHEGIVVNSLRNIDELKAMIKSKTFDEAKNVCNDEELNRIFSSNTTWPDTEKRDGLVASRYLESVSKGINALELAEVVEKDNGAITVPEYINDAIKWVLE
jgi:predicted ATP-dependent endonuclease of OLD family